MFDLRRFGNAQEHTVGEAGRRLFPLERMLQVVIHVRHTVFHCVFDLFHTLASPMTRTTFSRSMASERCRWLLTVATGIVKTSAISVGVRSSLYRRRTTARAISGRE